MNVPENYPERCINAASRVRAEDVVTGKQICGDLEQLGLSAGDTVCVHSAWRKIGYVIGGPRTVLDALLATVGPAGTIMMPTFTGELSDPANWKYPAVPPEMVDEVRAALPGFNPRLSPSRGMGTLPELLRHRPGAVRSPHPQSSFTAVGASAQELCGQHALDFRFGPQSPLDALTRHAGKVLMLGTPWNTASLFYLTEFAMPDRTECRMASPVETEAGVVWREFRDYVPRARGHEAIVHLVEHNMAHRGLVGRGDSVLFDAKLAIEETLRWCRPPG